MHEALRAHATYEQSTKVLHMMETGRSGNAPAQPNEIYEPISGSN